MTDDRESPPPDLPPAAGKRPNVERPVDERPGKVGTGTGYSGQEYDSAGQAEWRARQALRAAAPDGAVHGTGTGPGDEASGEEYDEGTAGAGVDQGPAGGPPGLGMTGGE